MSKSPGLYLHIPFCSAICPYCDFAVTTGGAERREGFTRALVREIELDRGPWTAFDTVYLGGGTPSTLSDEQLGRVMAALRSSFALAGGGPDHLAVSIEANPEDVIAARLRAWAALGIGRLSLGVQSFEPGELAFLGRRHSPGQALRAAEIGLAQGMVVSLDLIYGLPGQTAESWRRSLAQAVELGPHHLSCYQLTVEPGTPFATQMRRGDWAAASADTVADLFFLTHEHLGAAGYPAYEVSNFARAPEHQCSHNRKYWERAPYLGLGPSAHSFDGRDRWWNERSETAWRRRIEAGRDPEAGRELLSSAESALEVLMLGLRTPAGIDLGAVEGLAAAELLERNAEALDRLSKEGLLQVEDQRLVPTLRGMARADAVARSLEL